MRNKLISKEDKPNGFSNKMNFVCDNIKKNSVENLRKSIDVNLYGYSRIDQLGVLRFCNPHVGTFCQAFQQSLKKMFLMLKMISTRGNQESRKNIYPSSFFLNRKGYVYTLEVIIAVALIVISMTFILSAAQAPAPAETALIKRQGFEALQFLEQNDELRALAASGNEKQIKKRLQELLPPGIALEVDVCTSVCEGNLPKNRTIVAVDYYISGYREAYFTKKVRLWMWGSF